MRARSVGLVVAGWVLVCARGAVAGDLPIVAVFDMEDRGAVLSPEVRTSLLDYLAALLAEGGYQVIPQDQIRERLKQQKHESYKTCYDQGCQVELGRELAAEKTLATKILKIGNTCKVAGTLYDLKKAATEKAATAGGGCGENDLLKAVEEVAGKLTGKAKLTQQVERPAPAEERRAAPAQGRRTVRPGRTRAPESNKPQPAPAPEPAPPSRAPAAFLVKDLFVFGGLTVGPLITPIEGAGMTVDDPNGSYDLDTSVGSYLDFYLDVSLGNEMAVGAFLTFLHTEAGLADGPSEGLDMVGVGGRFKLRLQAGPRFEMRVTLSAGYGSVIDGGEVNGESLAGVGGLALGGSTDAVYYVTDSIGVVVSLGIFGVIAGSRDLDSGEKLEADITPHLFLSGGIEFGV